MNEKIAMLKKSVKKLMATSEEYVTYSEVPYFRKQWFFWLMFLGPLLGQWGIMFTMNSMEMLDAAIGGANWKMKFILLFATVGCVSQPFALFILLFGDVYYKRFRKVVKFGGANKFVAALLLLASLFYSIVQFFSYSAKVFF